VITPVAVQSCRLIPALLLPPADPAGAKPRRDHRCLARMSRHEVPMTAGKRTLIKIYDPARVSHIPVSQSVRHPCGVGIACIARSTGLRGYAPRPVAMERAPTRGASPPPGALSYRTGRCPIGQVGRGGRARCLIGRGDDPFAGVMDPDRDPRFIATGRAAIAAMTCGQIDLLTSTPPGCRTYQSVNQCDALAGSRDCLLCPVHGSSGLRPLTRG